MRLDQISLRRRAHTSRKWLVEVELGKPRNRSASGFCAADWIAKGSLLARGLGWEVLIFVLISWGAPLPPPFGQIAWQGYHELTDTLQRDALS